MNAGVSYARPDAALSVTFMFLHLKSARTDIASLIFFNDPYVKRQLAHSCVVVTVPALVGPARATERTGAPPSSKAGSGVFLAVLHGVELGAVGKVAFEVALQLPRELPAIEHRR